MFVMEALDVNWKAGAECFKKYRALSYFLSSASYAAQYDSISCTPARR